MAYLAIRGSGAVNAVSKLHGQVSRSLFAPLFPRWPEDDVPVSYVTNGVHMSSWDSASSDALWTVECGKERWQCNAVDLEGACAQDPRCQDLGNAQCRAQSSYRIYPAAPVAPVERLGCFS